MKKLFALLLCLVLMIPVLAVAETEITLWTYPIGSWSQSAVVDEIVANFNAVYPDIKVKVEYLDYTSGDDQVTAAIEAGTTPDIIFEGPERLVANWGANGKMMDISDLWTEETSADIAAAGESIKTICTGTDGNIYLYPLCMTTHCMVINKKAFDKSGLIYGIGHAVYTLSDPRTVVIRKYAELLAKEKGQMDLYNLYLLVEKLAPDVFHEVKKSDKLVCANVDFYAGLVYSMLGIPSELYTPLFACGRIAGWSAHRIEELVSGGRIMRPAFKCVNKRRAYVPAEERHDII